MCEIREQLGDLEKEIEKQAEPNMPRIIVVEPKQGRECIFEKLADWVPGQWTFSEAVEAATDAEGEESDDEGHGNPAAGGYGVIIYLQSFPLVDL